MNAYRQLLMRCEAYERDKIPYVGWAHEHGFGIVRLDEVPAEPLASHGINEGEAAYKRRLTIGGYKAQPEGGYTKQLSTASRKRIDKAIDKLRRDPWARVVRVEYHPDSGRQVIGDLDGIDWGR